MSSTVTNYSNNINVLYPIPGVDNDTQGFRDNFGNIKNALQAAAQELSNLNLNTSKLNTGTNDYNYGATIYRAPLKAVGFVTTTDDNVDADADINFLLGSYHQVIIDGAVKLTVTNLPQLYSTVRIEVKNENTGASSVDFDTSGFTVKTESTLTLPYDLAESTSTSHVFDLWSIDGGDTLFVKHVGDFDVI